MKYGGVTYEKITTKQEWYANGKRHCNDGPAVIFPDGEVEFWIDGVQVGLVEYYYMLNIVKQHKESVGREVDVHAILKSLVHMQLKNKTVIT